MADDEMNTVGLSVEQLIAFCSASCFRGYGSDEYGFHAVYSRVFEEILRQEVEGIDNEGLDLDSPDVAFGSENIGFEARFRTRDRTETCVQEFYAVMQSFKSVKSFRQVFLLLTDE
jgi:hypothetical protein